MDWKRDYLPFESIHNCSTHNKGHIISSVSDADQKKVYIDHWQSTWKHMSKNPGNILQNTTRTFMLPFIKILTGNLELLNYKLCTLWNSWRMKMPNLKHYYLAGSLTEINPVLKENLLYTKWRYKERWQVEMGFSSKSSCYCNQKKKKSVCYYAIKSVARWLVDNVQETGKRDPLITSVTETVPRSWVDRNTASSPAVYHPIPWSVLPITSLQFACFTI